VPGLSISELSRASGFTSSALRYYERVGLLAPTGRSAGGYRQYDDRALERLAFIARAKRLGLNLEEIGELVTLWEDGPCGPVQERLRALVDDKVAWLEGQVDEDVRFHAQLVHVRRSLESAEPADRCGPGCGCDTEWPETGAVPIALAAVRRNGAEQPIACTLAAEAVPDRLREWQNVLDRVEERRATAEGVRLRFPRDPELLASLAGVAAREVDCCSFFTFTLSLDADAAWLTVTAPGDAQPLITPLFGPVDG
jgi:DNA-binding transcriptional MerR regulator